MSNDVQVHIFSLPSRAKTRYQFPQPGNCLPAGRQALALGLAPPTGVGDHARSACETVFLAAGTEEIYEKVPASTHRTIRTNCSLQKFGKEKRPQWFPPSAGQRAENAGRQITLGFGRAVISKLHCERL